MALGGHDRAQSRRVEEIQPAQIDHEEIERLGADLFEGILKVADRAERQLPRQATSLERPPAPAAGAYLNPATQPANPAPWEAGANAFFE
jgi:hypothetical protein